MKARRMTADTSHFAEVYDKHKALTTEILAARHRRNEISEEAKKLGLSKDILKDQKASVSHFSLLFFFRVELIQHLPAPSSAL